MKVTLVISMLCVVVTSTTYNDPNTLDIASFNLKIFGLKKMTNELTKRTLVKIIRRYDLILIQEIRDSSGDAIKELMGLVKREDQRYTMVLSERLGRTSSKEQYAAIYRQDWLILEDTYTYADPKDVFEREPFITKFVGTDKLGIGAFAVANIHTSPSDAQNETNHLADVYDNIVNKWYLKDVFIIGDYNADCDYIKQWKEIALATQERFYWLIDDTKDTTTKSTDCTYDRIVVAGERLMRTVIPSSPSVLHFDKEYGLTEKQTDEVSDHYPVSIQLRSSYESTHVEASSSVRVHDKRISTSLTKRMIYFAFQGHKDQAFYTKSGAYAIIIVKRTTEEGLTGVSNILKELLKLYPTLVGPNQIYTMERLVRDTNPIRYMPRGYGRYQTLYDYYKNIQVRYTIQLVCEIPACWIDISRSFP